MIQDYFPVVGPVLLIVNLVKHKGLMNSLKELNERFELAKKQGENAIESITAASRKFPACPRIVFWTGVAKSSFSSIDQLDSLLAGIKGVRDTIENAIKSVDKMQSECPTHYRIGFVQWNTNTFL